MLLKRALVVVACCLVSVFTLGGSAFASVLPSTMPAGNDACLSCHDVSGGAAVTVDFGVGTVDRSTACNKCHWISPHPKHFATAQCGGCHASWYTPARTDFYQSVVSSPFGWFSSVTSPYVAAEDLHAIHTERTWLAEVKDYSPKCGSCHAAAACDACHEQPVTHGTHGVEGDSAVGSPTQASLVSVAPGLPVGDTGKIDRQTNTASACAASSCHAGVDSHETIDDSSPRITYSGTWTTLTDASLAGGSVHYTTDTTAYLELTFSGTEIAWTGERSTSGGIVEMYVDGVLWGETDTSLTVRGYSKVLRVIRNLSPGEHTLRLQGTGRKNVASTGYKFSVQLLDARTAAAAFSAVPACSSCHEQHGDLTALHQSSWSMEGCTGDACHPSRRLDEIHDRSIPEGTCDVCHGADVSGTVSDAVSAGVTACDGCHTGVAETSGHRTVHGADPALVDANGVPQYGYYTGSLSTAPTSDCTMCHTSNLVDEHMGISGVRLPREDIDGDALTCATCHDSSKFEVLQAIASGISACEACHPVHGPVFGATHASTFTPAGDSGCSACHDDNLAAEHEALRTTTTDGSVLGGCALCHDNTAGARGLEIQTAIDVTNDTRCTACHAGYHTDAVQSHTASSDASISGCGACHKDGLTTDGFDVTVVHGNVDTPGPCTVCHANPSRVPEITAKTAECGSCHAVAGVEYHSQMASAHTYTAMDPSCTGGGCHAANTLPEAHEAYLSRYPEYSDTCSLCHRNTDSGRIDWETASADCSTCHTVHGDITVLHTAPSSTECVECHETADVRVIHGASPEASCATCHNATVDLTGKTTRCVDCHVLSPVSTRHYPADTHLAVTETGCTNCHSRDMMTEHAKSTVGVTCVQCHETKVDAFTSAWDKTCEECHSDTHAQQVERHASTRTDCSRSGCHATDVSTIHSKLPGMGCTSCHTSPDQASLTKNCTDAGCHGSTYHSFKIVSHTATSSTYCARCHDKDTAVGVNVEPVHKDNCDTCHVSSSRVPDVSAKTAECSSCHATSGTDYHKAMGSKHTFVGMSAVCVSAGCHVSKTLPEEHDRFVGAGKRYSTYQDSCALCHENTNSARINWNTASADCSTCHTVHGDMTVIHTAPSSGECVDCHKTADVRNLHGANPAASCVVCHNATVNLTGKTTQCVKCHAYSPASTQHPYGSKVHVASAQFGCRCHSMNLISEHTGWRASVTCVECHTYSLFPANGWDKKCAACHPRIHGGGGGWR